MNHRDTPFLTAVWGIIVGVLLGSLLSNRMRHYDAEHARPAAPHCVGR